MTFLNTAAYQFVTLTDLNARKDHYLALGRSLNIKGTILLGKEGINIMLAGQKEAILAFETTLRDDTVFGPWQFKHSTSIRLPFRRFLVKIKPEIIATGRSEINPQQQTGAHMPPSQLRQWLDEGRDFLLLDTRNNYEIEFGAFAKAVHLQIEHFRDFASALTTLPSNAKEKPVVMYCTGGIRCEKASAMMQNQGFKEVYQLDGGILNYFEQCGGEHYQKNCYVFDDRVAITPQLTETNIQQCQNCHQPVIPISTEDNDSHPASYEPYVAHCARCESNGVIL